MTMFWTTCDSGVHVNFLEKSREKTVMAAFPVRDSGALWSSVELGQVGFSRSLLCHVLPAPLCTHVLDTPIVGQWSEPGNIRDMHAAKQVSTVQELTCVSGLRHQPSPVTCPGASERS